MNSLFVLTLSDALNIVFFGLILFVYFCFWATDAIKQWKCPHLSRKVTTKGRVICATCGKDLGKHGSSEAV